MFATHLRKTVPFGLRQRRPPRKILFQAVLQLRIFLHGFVQRDDLAFAIVRLDRKLREACFHHFPLVFPEFAIFGQAAVEQGVFLTAAANDSHRRRTAQRDAHSRNENVRQKIRKFHGFSSLTGGVFAFSETSFRNSTSGMRQSFGYC